VVAVTASTRRRAASTPSTRPTHTSDAVEGPTSDRDAPRNVDRDTRASRARRPRPHAVAATLASIGTGLLVWVTAISKYFDVAKNVEPLKAKVRDMEKQQAKTTKLLADLNDQLGVLSKELGELDSNFKEKNEELTGLQTQAALMEKRLAAASKLITGLTGERTRWTSDIGELNNSKVQLVGDCLLAASFLSYAGAFTSDFRAGMIYETFAKKVRCSVEIFKLYFNSGSLVV
jgi:dynein heavy chain